MNLISGNGRGTQKDVEEEAAYLKTTYLDEITRTKGKFGSRLVFPTSFALGSQI